MRKSTWLTPLGLTASYLVVALFTGSTAIGTQDHVEARINLLVSQLTLEEKVKMVGGNEFETFAIPRLGIPALKMADGPIGVRVGKSTAFPAGIAMAATFNPELINNVAIAIADETRIKGRHMLLGPAVNLSRHPFGGRNFESYGEDPFLASQLAAAYVRGIQSRNVLASVKHFAVNDQETDRKNIDTIVDMRTLFELHLPAFKAAIDAGSWTVMSAYNKINGHHASENDFLLNQVLRRKWGFRGFVVSDWESTHSTINAANHGLDLEMPNGANFNHKLVQAVREGHVKESVIDDKIRRLLRTMFAIGLIEPERAPKVPDPIGANSREHNLLARRTAQESIVLLKNDSLLPLKNENVRSIAVLGPNAAFLRNGGGSSHVEPVYKTTVLQAIRDRFGRNIEIRYEAGAPLPGEHEPVPSAHLRPSMRSNLNGLKAEVFANRELEGLPVLTRLDSSIDVQFHREEDPRLKSNFSVRWTGFMSVPTSGRYRLKTLSDDGVRVFLSETEVISNWTEHGPSVDTFDVELTAGQWYPIRVEYFQSHGDSQITFAWEPLSQSRIERAVTAARNADVAVIVAGLHYHYEGEAWDRKTMDLPEGQDDLIREVSRVNPNTVVVIHSGNPVRMGDWLGNVKAVMQAWYGGQEGGRAVADVLFGDANPSGKLPVTFLKKWEDSPAFGNYPGADGRVEYKEGVFIGYRHFDARGVEPEFPFGHGLSYTQFSYQQLEIKRMRDMGPHMRLEFALTNSGDRAGSEVAQVYVGELNPLVPRPPKELKGFAKVHLAPGETQRVSIELDASAFSYFDAASMKWRVNAGQYRVQVGSSSRDIRLSETIVLR